MTAFQFANRISQLGAPYSPPKPSRVPDLDLRDVVPNFVPLLPSGIGSYPNTVPFRDALAASLGVPQAFLHITAGADDALIQLSLAYLESDKNIVACLPTFPMMARYATIAGAELRSAAWLSGDFPIDEFLSQVDDNTTIIMIVSPNNPTGLVTPFSVIQEIRRRVPHALLLLDAVYMAYADENITEAVLSLPHSVVVQSFSKASGAAGLRLGYAISRDETILTAMKKVAQPYAVSTPSLEIGLEILKRNGAFVEAARKVKKNRDVLMMFLREIGFNLLDSQANFVFITLDNPKQARKMFVQLGERGISVRCFPDDKWIANALRIGVPYADDDLEKLMKTIQEITP